MWPGPRSTFVPIGILLKTPLGTEVDLGPDGDPAPPAKGAQQLPPLFVPCLLRPRSPISATAELLLTDTDILITSVTAGPIGNSDRVTIKFYELSSVM